MTRPPLLIFTRFFWPGYKGGGPVQSMTALVEWLGDRFDIHLATRDRDVGDAQRYSVIGDAFWTQKGAARVRYIHEPRVWSQAPRVMKTLPSYRLVLNNVFNPVFSVLPLCIRRLRPGRVVKTFIFPRGEFDPGALRQSARKKQVFIRALRASGLWRGVTWIATSDLERDNVLRVLPGAHVEVAQNLIPKSKLARPARVPIRKQPGAARLVFVSRINPKKGLLALLQALPEQTGEIDLDIIGPVSDAGYWAECQAVLSEMPLNVRVHYRGELPNAEVLDALGSYHVMVLPTRGENYGHIIAESFLAGVPVALPDTTPWTDALRRGAGVLIDRGVPAALDALVAMDDAAYRRACTVAAEVKLDIEAGVAAEAERLAAILSS